MIGSHIERHVMPWHYTANDWEQANGTFYGILPPQWKVSRVRPEVGNCKIILMVKMTGWMEKL
jgi:hypothetical protein